MIVNKVRLVFKGISEIVGSEEVGLLNLVDEKGERQLTIPCDKYTIHQFAIRESEYNKIVNSFLPEVLLQVLQQSDCRLEIIIHDLVDGQYITYLHDMGTQKNIPMRASDAILLAYISNVPLYIEKKLMSIQSVKCEKEQYRVRIPVNVISDEMLHKELEKAIQDENYELASQLRDEMNRRKYS